MKDITHPLCLRAAPTPAETLANDRETHAHAQKNLQISECCTVCITQTHAHPPQTHTLARTHSSRPATVEGAANGPD